MNQIQDFLTQKTSVNFGQFQYELPIFKKPEWESNLGSPEQQPGLLVTESLPIMLSSVNLT